MAFTSIPCLFANAVSLLKNFLHADICIDLEILWFFSIPLMFKSSILIEEGLKLIIFVITSLWYSITIFRNLFFLFLNFFNALFLFLHSNNFLLFLFASSYCFDIFLWSRLTDFSILLYFFFLTGDLYDINFEISIESILTSIPIVSVFFSLSCLLTLGSSSAASEIYTRSSSIITLTFLYLTPRGILPFSTNLILFKHFLLAFNEVEIFSRTTWSSSILIRYNLVASTLQSYPTY